MQWDKDNLVVSSACNPDLSLEEILPAYARLGYRKFEGYCTWTSAAFDTERDPAYYLDLARSCGIAFASVQLPTINDNFETSLARAVKAAHFASALGASTVGYRANSIATQIRAARPFLDAVESLPITPVIQNHCGTCIKTLDDYRQVIEGINDPRMKTLLELGHFHTAGVHWREAYNLLAGTIALVHLKDQIGAESVAFGRGEIDMAGFLAHMHKAGYTGDFVVEIEVKDKDNTFQYLTEAQEFFRACWR